MRHMEVNSTKRRRDCDADGVVDVPVGGLVA
jgi:hypothetical protein